MFSGVAYSQWIIRGLSVIIAVFLWFHVDNKDQKEKNTLIQVEFIKPVKKNLVSDFKFTNREVMVHVEGKKEAVNTAIAYLRNRKGVVDLKYPIKGTKGYKIELEVEKDNVILKEVDISLVPEAFNIRFQEYGEKTVFIQADVKDLNGKQHKVISWEYTPRKVRIRGLEDKIEKIKSVKTERYIIKNRKKDFSVPLSFRRLPSHVEIIKTKKVTLTVKIDDGKRERIFKNVKVLTFGIPPNSNLTLRTEDLKLDSIVYRGMPKALDAINPKDVVAYVVLENKIGEQTVEPKLPGDFKDVKIIRHSPKKLTVNVIRVNKRKR